ncbi:hypothetical protein DPEC_G00184570 [Dallia pectoralis]|uniref:Uncharacterized protein n=1 Tax=Dallia pectoralis TaxID=75939 RepID=A0ACC2GBC9_DALPE|nr:hypothetical protein DPEC_G00184570 [Dallia pectoralis]
MNDTSRNVSFTDPWIYCLDHGYVTPMICQSTEVLCFLLGTPALVWCLWISLSGSISGGLKPTQIFPMNLCIVELLFCIEGLFQTIYYLFLPNNNMFLQVVYCLFFIAWVCRPLFQTCICVERYMAVVQPVAFIKYRLRRYRMGTSTLIWGLAIIYPCFTVSSLGYLTKTNDVLVSVYCLGGVVISFCCFFILRALKQPGPGEVEGGRGGEKKQRTTDPQKMRAFSIVLTNLVIILVSSILVAVGFFTMPNSGIDFYCNTFLMLLACNMLSVVVSPVLHLHREGRLHCRKGPVTN